MALLQPRSGAAGKFPLSSICVCVCTNISESLSRAVESGSKSMLELHMYANVCRILHPASPCKLQLSLLKA